METKREEVFYRMNEKKKQLDVEVALHGGYVNWFDELEEFRKQLKEYGRIYLSPDGRETVVNDGMRLVNGHYIDHHISAYFMPLSFRRIGFEMKPRTPAEQLIYMSEKLKERGIRLLYVPLPNKKCIYPELVASNSVIPEDRIMIPQCHKIINELIEGGVEVLDMYPEFIREKDLMLYQHMHMVSPKGAELVGKKIAKYLLETTSFEDDERILQLKTMDINIPTKDGVKANEFIYYPGKYVYSLNDGLPKLITGTDVSSEICLIGDCNTQWYMENGSSIIAHLSHYLKYPIEYGGRCLPFNSVNRLNTIAKGKLAGKKILIYVAFVSAAWVRAVHSHMLWNIDFIYDNAFEK